MFDLPVREITNDTHTTVILARAIVVRTRGVRMGRLPQVTGEAGNWGGTLMCVGYRLLLAWYRCKWLRAVWKHTCVGSGRPNRGGQTDESITSLTETLEKPRGKAKREVLFCFGDHTSKYDQYYL